MEYEEQRKLGIRLFRGEKYKELRRAIKDGKCYDNLAFIAEKAGAIELWGSFPDEWTYWAVRYWSISDEMRKEAFLKLTDEFWIYSAGCDWSIPDEMRQLAFLQLKKDIFRYHAGCCWSGISDEMLKEAYSKFENDAWKNWAGRYWEGVHYELCF